MDGPSVVRIIALMDLTLVRHVIPGQRQPVDLRPAPFTCRDAMIDWHEAEVLRWAARGDWSKAQQHAIHGSRLEAIDALAAR